MHPSIRIIYLLALAWAVHIASPMTLVALIAVSSGFLLYNRAENFLQLLRRTYWMFLFLLVIYAFNTPGEYLRQWPFDMAPTYEGLQSGLVQISRIVIMLAGVALLLKATPQEDLMAGFFLLMYPLTWIRLHPERLAVRLWLTLHYLEEAPPTKSIGRFLQSLDKLHSVRPTSAPEQIRIVVPALCWVDVAALLALAGLGIYLL